MTARADVRVGELRGVLLLPVNAVFEQQGSFVCHVVHLLGVETRLVTLGESSDTQVAVSEGLREGERVALTDIAGGAPAATPPPVQALQLPAGGGVDKPRLAPR